MTISSASPIGHIGWTPARGIRALDQTRLPAAEHWLALDDLADVADAIRRLRVRGAPLIGIVGAMGVAGEAQRVATTKASLDAVQQAAQQAADLLVATRPTAVNLPWAIARMRGVLARPHADGAALAEALIAEAQAIWDEDAAMCAAIGRHGLDLLPDGAVVHTHCNAGALATGGIGTALAPVYAAAAAGRRIHVVADETRPLLQGSRLTAWELHRAGVSVEVIADGMAASRLRRGDVTCVLVGADRIAANGDVANKIGTYALALAARAAKVPFYVAAPSSTLDRATPHGDAIVIEERAADEVLAFGAQRTGPAGAQVWNPAFDVTPAALVTGILTDRGLVAPSAIRALSV
jgi:methylthioribose-1-phosphate isomerase